MRLCTGGGGLGTPATFVLAMAAVNGALLFAGLTTMLRSSGGQRRVEVREAEAETQSLELAQALLSRLESQEKILQKLAEDKERNEKAGGLLDPDSYPSEFDFDLWHRVHQERAALLNKGCREMPPIYVNNGNVYKRENFFLLPPYQLGYCHMPKTGSTTIVNHLQQVYEGYRNEEEEAEISGGRVFEAFGYLTDNFGVDGPKENILDELSHVSTFIFVRHPFVRFVSAYRMRFYLLSTAIGRRFNETYDRGEIPPFRTFVDFFLENDQQFQRVYLSDKHLRTISGQCDVCRIGVSVVGKSETFDWDMQYLKERFGVPFQNLDLKKHVRRGDSSEDLAKEWFATLTKAQIRRLYDVFQVDFVLYGYSDAQDYIDLGIGD